MGEKKILYKGRLSEVGMFAGFGIRNGKLSLIELGKDDYQGPTCLGLFCMDMDVDVSPRDIFRKLGPPAQKASGFSPYYCYQSEGGLAFLHVGAGHEVPPAIDEVFLSDFPNCMHTSQKVTAEDLHAWKTPEGIGLGSSRQDVLKAYGMPSKVERTKSRTCCADIIIGYKKGEAGPDIGDEVFLYNSSGLRRTEFGMRNSRISYIWLSDSE